MIAYCDKIADVARKALLNPDTDNIIGNVGHVKFDLHPTGGYLMSTKKTIKVSDKNGKMYTITIEED